MTCNKIRQFLINALMQGLGMGVSFLTGLGLYNLTGKSLTVTIAIVIGSILSCNLLCILASKVECTKNLSLSSSMIGAMNAIILALWSEFLFVHHFGNSSVALELLGFVISLAVACAVALFSNFVTRWHEKNSHSESKGKE
jgi:hypothetical protein